MAEVTPAAGAVEAPVADSGVAGTPAAEPKAVSLADDALIEYKVGGETRTGKWADIRQTQAMLPADYTRKMQTLADQRRDFEAKQQAFTQREQQVEQLRQQLSQTAQDPQKLAALYLASVASKRAGEQGGQPAQFDPNQLAQGIQRQLQAEMQQQFQAFQEQQAAAKIEGELDTFTSGLLKGHSTLAALPGVSELVYGQVLKMGPANMDEAKDYASKVIQDFASKLDTSIQESKKAATRERALSGIEPKGGSALKPQARKYSGIDDPQRLEDMTAFFKQALSGDEE